MSDDDHKERHANYMREFYKKHPGYSTKYVRKWRESHPVENKEAHKEYRDKPQSKEQKLAKQRQRRAADPYYSTRSRATKWGLTAQQLVDMVAAQGGLCASCRLPPQMKKYKVLAVDHDHVTGKVRGLLCHNCNVTLGLQKDSIERLEALIAYLKRTM